MYQIIQFLKFFYRAINKHGIHSPFIFEFIENVIEDDRWFYAFDEIEFLRESLKKEQIQIPKIDLGAGSKKLNKNSNSHQLREILSSSVSRPYKCRVLFRLIEHLNLKIGIELGTSLGISSAYLANASISGHLYTIEANSHLCQLAKQLHQSLKISNCTIIQGEFEDTLQNLRAKLPRLDYVFIDGNHNYTATLKYIEILLPVLHDKSVLIVDDIYWSKEMTTAWYKIISDKKVSLSLDLFYFGLVFFTTNFKEKQNFKLWSPLKKILLE